MPIRTVGEYFQRWGFTSQKPLKRAYEQRTAEVQNWLEEDHPSIAERARREKAEIHWSDETGIRSDSQHGRSYAPKGKTPVIRFWVKRASKYMISTVTNQGRMNAKCLIRFFKQLFQTTGQGCRLEGVADSGQSAGTSCPTGRGMVGKDGKQQRKIEVFFLPAYSPELNPDEYLHYDLRAGVHSRSPARDVDNLKKKVRSHMTKLQKTPARVRNISNIQKIAYAA